MRIVLITAALMTLSTGMPSHVLAQGDAVTPPEEAMLAFQAGREHYAAGRYEEAATALERALTLDPNSKTLVFNLTRVYELLGRLNQAIHFGQQYRLMVEHDPEEVERADATLRRLEGAQAYLALREEAQDGAPELRQLAPRVIVHERGVADGAFWAVLGTGAGLTLAGAIIGAAALRTNIVADDIAAANDQDRVERRDLRADADTLALTADIVMLAGAATMTAALLLYLLRVRTFERETVATTRLDIIAAPGLATISLEQSF